MPAGITFCLDFVSGPELALRGIQTLHTTTPTHPLTKTAPRTPRGTRGRTATTPYKLLAGSLDRSLDLRLKGGSTADFR